MLLLLRIKILKMLEVKLSVIYLNTDLSVKRSQRRSLCSSEIISSGGGMSGKIGLSSPVQDVRRYQGKLMLAQVKQVTRGDLTSSSSSDLDYLIATNFIRQKGTV